MKYEYKVFRLLVDSIDAKVKQAILNKHGEEGWRCFSITNGNVDVEYVFEREIKPPPKTRSKKS